MYFKYNVIATKAVSEQLVNADDKGFVFQPTTLEVYVGQKESIKDVDGITDVDVMNVQTVLTETLTNGTTVQTKNHQFPLSVLPITGFDVNTMQPIVDATGLNNILTGFFLQLTA